MDNNYKTSTRAESYRIFFNKSREIVKIISDSFIYDSKNVNSKINTVWDQKISNEIKKLLIKEAELSKFKFYSEEEPASSLQTPIFLIDPIDGSREFLLNIPECVVSMSFIDSWNLNETNSGSHWIWNFRNNFEIMSCENNFQKNTGLVKPLFEENSQLRGLVSRREWEEGGFKQFSDKVLLKPMGSIAYKLALLSQSYCDFVFSKSNKNIWDIAAGTFILENLGYSLFDKNGKIESLERTLINGPLLWCKIKDFELLSGLMK